MMHSSAELLSLLILVQLCPTEPHKILHCKASLDGGPRDMCKGTKTATARENLHERSCRERVYRGVRQLASTALA
jgi:hypothetical protein